MKRLATKAAGNSASRSERIHAVNRDEVHRILDKINAEGTCVTGEEPVLGRRQ